MKDRIEAQNEMKSKEKEEKEVIAQQVLTLNFPSPILLKKWALMYTLLSAPLSSLFCTLDSLICCSCRTCMHNCCLLLCLLHQCPVWAEVWEAWAEGMVLRLLWEEWACLRCHLMACHQWAAATEMCDEQLLWNLMANLLS